MRMRKRSNEHKMDSLLESAKTYIDVLKCSSSDEVSSWKIEDLERAVNWAEYFKRVQGRLQKKPALVRKFDSDLKKVGLQAGLRFGRQELSSQFLGDSLNYLITALLENPFLPSKIQELIHQKYANADQLAHLEKVSSDRALLATLTTIHHKLTANLPPHVPPLQKSGPLLVADSLVLQEEVEWLLTLQPRDSESTQTCTLPHSVCTKLEGLAKQEHGLEVILLSTMSQPHAPSTSTEQNTNAFGIILQWLVQKMKVHLATLPTATSAEAHSATALPKQTVHVDIKCLTNEDVVVTKLWELSPHLLANVSAKHLEFFRVYFELLTSRVSQLQAEVTREFQDQGTQQHCSEGLEKGVLPYFRALVAADPNVRDITLALMTSQVEQTALQLLAVGVTCSRGTHSGAIAQPKGIEYPANLWSKVLDKCCDESGHDKNLGDII